MVRNENSFKVFMKIYFIILKNIKGIIKERKKYFVVIGHKYDIKPKLLAFFFLG